MTMSDDRKSSGGNASFSGSSSRAQSARDRLDVILPQSKVKVIMKSSPDTENVGLDALFLITKAAELFIDHMASNAYNMGKGKRLDYKNVSEFVKKNNTYEFLQETVPPKIPFRVALQEVAKQQALLKKQALE